MELECTGLAFTKVIDGLSNILDEAILNIDPITGISIHMMDATHISMVQLRLTPDFFSKFSLPAPIRIKINVHKVREIVTRKMHYDRLSITLHDNNLIFKLRSEKQKSCATLSSKLVAIFDDDEDKIQSPTFPISASLAIKGTYLKDAANLVSSSEYFTLDISPTGMNFTIFGDDGDANLSFASEDGVFLTKPTGSAKSSYSVEKFLNTVKLLEMSEQVTVQMGTDTPIGFEFESPRKELNAKIYISPRVEEDDEEAKDAEAKAKKRRETMQTEPEESDEDDEGDITF